MNSTDILIEAVMENGLPVSITTWGRISENTRFAFRGSSALVVTSEESLKADFIVGNDEDYEPAYSDLESLKAVIQAMINGEFCGEDLKVVDTHGSIRLITVQIDDEPVTTNHDFSLLVSEQEFSDQLSKKGVDIDVDDIVDELPEICLTHCVELLLEKTFMSFENTVVVTFASGSKLKFGKNNDLIIVV